MSNVSGVKQPRLVLKYFASVLMLALLAYATFRIPLSWWETKSDQADRLETIADLSEIAIDTYFTQLEIGLRNLGSDLHVKPGKPDLDRAFKVVSLFQALHTELGNVMLIRADGQILLTGMTPYNANLPTLAKDPSFLKFRAELQQGSSFVIGKPVMSHIVMGWVSAARYAVTDKSGRLLYILSANLPDNLLQRYWLNSTTPRISALGLVRDDGYLVSRYPEPDDMSRDELYGKPVNSAMVEYLSAKDYPKHGQVTIRGSNGKVKDILALRRLEHYPVTLFVEMPMSEIKVAWWEDLHAPYFLMALLLAAVFAAYGLSIRRRKAWTSAERREALRHNYEQALHERSPNEIFMLNTDTLKINYANENALESLGYSLKQLQQMNLLALQPELGVESFGEKVEPLRSGNREAITYQTNQVRANGSSYPVEVNLQLITSDDDGEEFMAIINDLTALRLAEENIRKFNSPVERRAKRRE